MYDGECPFCSRYVHLLRLRDAVGPLQLVSAREDHQIVRYVRSRGVVLDRDMAFVKDGRIYAGADCIHRLALMSTRSDAFNRLNALVFSSPAASRLLYPVLRLGRNLALWALSRPRIGERK